MHFKKEMKKACEVSDNQCLVNYPSFDLILECKDERNGGPQLTSAKSIGENKVGISDGTIIPPLQPTIGIRVHLV